MAKGVRKKEEMFELGRKVAGCVWSKASRQQSTSSAASESGTRGYLGKLLPIYNYKYLNGNIIVAHFYIIN